MFDFHDHLPQNVDSATVKTKDKVLHLKYLRPPSVTYFMTAP